jgi:hypothetical protein
MAFKGPRGTAHQNGMGRYRWVYQWMIRMKPLSFKETLAEFMWKTHLSLCTINYKGCLNLALEPDIGSFRVGKTTLFWRSCRMNHYWLVVSTYPSEK